MGPLTRSPWVRRPVKDLLSDTVQLSTAVTGLALLDSYDH